MISVTVNYLVISNFVPHQRYSAAYVDELGYWTSKMTYRGLGESTGFMRCVASLYSNEGNERNAIKATVFRKMPFDVAFTLREE